MRVFNLKIGNYYKGFTLVELLVVLGIVAVMSTVVIIALNPVELLKQSRDSGRISDLNTIGSALSAFSADVGQINATSSVVYVSLPSSVSDCSNLGLPALPGGWSYACSTSANYKKADGTGWIPINFGSLSFGSPLSQMPVDPTNSSSTGLYYTFVLSGTNWELTAILESVKYGPKMVIDGGLSSNAYESGTDLTLTPSVALERGASGQLPTLSSISPTSATQGGNAFTLVVNGSSFSSSSIVTWGGANRTTTFVSSSTLNAAILAGDIAATGTVSVAVTDPAGNTGAQNFTINAPIVFNPGNAWITDATSGPVGAAGASIVDVGGAEYAFTGSATTFRKYNPASKTWTALASSTAATSNGGFLMKYDNDTIYALRGGGTTSFWKYTISSNTWSTMASTTLTTESGGSLMYPGTGDYIYALRGGGYQDVMRYSISRNNWRQPTQSQAAGSAAVDVGGIIYYFSNCNNVFQKFDPSTENVTDLATSPSVVCNGAALAKYNSDTIYALAGNNGTTFMKYVISSNTWSPMASTTCGGNGGGALTYPGTGDYLYALCGTGSTGFNRYSVSGDSWSAMASVPAGVWGGGSLTSFSTDSIYAFTAQSTASFYKYSIASNTWVGKASAPASLNSGAGLANDGIYVYGIQGSGGSGFWKYDTNANTWSALTSVPVTVGCWAWNGCGAAITYSSTYNKVFVLPGSGTTILEYNISGDTWPIPVSIPAQVYGGGSWVALSSDTTYAFSAKGTSNFYKYIISTGAWTSMTAAPAVVNSGGQLATDGTNIYAVQGSASNAFWKYVPGSNSWSALATTTVVVGCGAWNGCGGGMTYSSSLNSFFAFPDNGSNAILKLVSQ